MLPLICFIAVMVGTYLAWYYLDGIRKLTRDFAGPSVFNGPLYECRVYGMTIGEAAHVLCSVGANAAAVYLTSPPKPPRRGFFTAWKDGNPALLKIPILLPWSALLYRRKRFLLKECIRFHVPSNKSYFYIPLPIAEKLFSDAGRQIPGPSV